MAHVIYPDGTSKAFDYRGINDAQRELGGCFDSVGGLVTAGYLVLVHDEGRLIPLPRNAAAEILTGYPELYGPAVVVSYEEAREEEILHRVSAPARAEFERRLAQLTAVRQARE